MTEDRGPKTENRKISVFCNLFSVFCIILLGTIAYSNSFHGEFQFDDKDFIVNNPAIRDISDIKALWRVKGEHTRFLSFLTFALNYHLSGLDVFGYHLLNFLIHVFNSLLVWWLARLTLSSPALPAMENKIRERSSFFAALIFLLHPIQTEAVTYISQRFASLATFFYLLSLCLFIIYRRRGKIVFIITSLLAGACAMLSKQIAFTLPIIIIVYDIYFHKRNPERKKTTISLIKAAWQPALTFLIFILFIPFLYKFNVAGILGREYISRSHEGDYLFWLTYLLTQFRVLCHYIRLLFLPWPLNFDYDFSASITLWDPATLLSFIFLTTLFIFAIKIFSRERLISFCILWFFITLIVESTIIVLPHVIYEHRLYLPMVGFALMVSHLIFSSFVPGLRSPFRCSDTSNAARIPTRASLPIAVITIILFFYVMLTFQRNNVWKTGISLWNDVIAKSPQKSRPYHNRGFHYLEKGMYPHALKDFNKAIELEPRYLQAYSNRATVYRVLGRPLEAMNDYNEAIRLQPNNAQALHNRAQLFAASGQFEKALADYTQALEIIPKYFLAYHNRGQAYIAMKQYDLAITDLTTSIELYPDFPFSYGQRGKAYLYLNKNEEAIADFTKAITLKADDVTSYNNRAIVYGKIKNYTDALKDFDRVIELAPTNAFAYFNRSLIHLVNKNISTALQDAKKAQELGVPLPKDYLKQLEETSQ